MQNQFVKSCGSCGLGGRHLAYVGKSPDSGYSPFVYKKPLDALDVEISEDMFIMTSEGGKACKAT